MPSKVKRSVTLDEDLVAVIGEGNLSAHVNALLRRDAEHELHLQALERLLAGMVGEEGPLDTVADEAVMRAHAALLGASPEQIDALFPPAAPGAARDVA